MPSKNRKFIKMDALKQFTILLKSIGERTHRFDFQVDNHFFAQFEDSLIQDGQFDIVVEFKSKIIVKRRIFALNIFKTKNEIKEIINKYLSCLLLEQSMK